MLAAGTDAAGAAIVKASNMDEWEGRMSAWTHKSWTEALHLAARRRDDTCTSWSYNPRNRDRAVVMGTGGDMGSNVVGGRGRRAGEPASGAGGIGMEEMASQSSLSRHTVTLGWGGWVALGGGQRADGASR